MTPFNIKEFWLNRLNLTPIDNSKLTKGWESVREGLSSFVEAPMSLSKEVKEDSQGPYEKEIILVSAPGAVGKTTLARELAFRTGGIYIDLAKADPVGGNTITGGLAKSNTYNAWVAGTTTALIDGLDEARIRVTQEAYVSFLSDVAELSRGRKTPTVLFGRSGAIQDAWIFLSELNARSCILEIDYYDLETSIDFASALLNQSSLHLKTEKDAVRKIITRLREQTESDGDRFSGYAPVLKAVAKRVSNEGNAASIVADLEKGGKPITLRAVADGIMERERGKLKSLAISDHKILDTLYNQGEQLDWLVSRRFGLEEPQVPSMSPDDEQIYRNALETWVNDHPFIKSGSGESTSAVFDALISVRALRGKFSSEKAVQKELGMGSSANPFLSEFYLEEIGEGEYISPEHIGLVYASFRARLSLGDTASLVVSFPDDEDDEEALLGDVEISLNRSDSTVRTIHFTTDQLSPLQFGACVEDIEVTAPFMTVEFFQDPETIFIAPVSIQCGKIVVKSKTILVEPPMVNKNSIGESNCVNYDNGIIFLESESFDGNVSSIPIVRIGSSLIVSWPGVRVHPWISFSAEPTRINDPKIDEAMRRFRKYIIAFRSHSKGRLARYRAKLDHKRMSKGCGRRVLDLLLDEGIVTFDEKMYYLDANLLGSKAGTSYKECMECNFSSKVIEFISRA
ncbi:MAG: hypothetical protein K9H25_11425 [Rhodospirillum sp.]|nr:hypothetical protein [Rhodospirillum sp.]MCF8489836.1 hypothetical protein [Rhodospirillum sp.]MCF8499669.1 hypothetical protein [Rhodospirillum sp.]